MIKNLLTKLSIRCVFGAIAVSSLLTSELAALLLGLSYTLPDGLIHNIAFTLSEVCALFFFVWFSFYAYKVELKLRTENYDAINE